MSNKEVARFFRHSTIYAIGNALNRVGAFLLLPIYTRLLSTGEYGALETFYLVSTVVSGILAVGIAHATLRFYFDYKDVADRNAVISSNLIASMVISAIGVGLIWPFTGHLDAWLFKGQDFGQATRWMLATIVFELGSQVALSYVRAMERSMLFIAVSLAKLVVQVVANSVALMVFHAGVEGVLIGNFITVAMGWLLLSAYTVRHCGLRFQLDKMMPVLRYSFPFLLTTGVGIVSSTVDRFLLQSLVSLEALGIYALASKFSKLISDLVGEPVNRAYGAFRYTIMEREDAPLIQARVTRYLAVILTAAALAVVLFVGNLLDLMADPAYRPAAQYLPWLALAAVLQVLVYPMQTGIYYQKQSGQIFWVALTQSVVGAVAGLVLIWAFGILGACLTVLLVAVATVLMTHRISQRYFVVHYEWGRLARLLALATLLTLAGLAVDSAPLPWSLAGKVLLLLAFVPGLRAFGVLEAAEMAAGRAMLMRRLRPWFGSKPA
jgi:O-antigen/teichoic acid export membrane protein